MNFQQLKYFTVLCEKKNFNKAADSLYITPQGLNMALTNLEAELSCRLFKRIPGGLELTEEGEFFKPRAEAILREVEQCWNHFEGREDEADIVHAVGCQGALSEFGAKVVQEFEEKYSGHVHIREYTDRRVDREMADGTADIGFGLEPLDTKIFECHRVFQCPLVLLMHVDDPLTRLDRIPTSILAEQNLIVVDESFKSADVFLAECREQGVELVPKFRVGEISAVHRLVQQGMGVGLTNASVADCFGVQDTTYRYFESEKFMWNVDIFKRRNAVLSRSANHFFEYILRRYADDYCMKYAPDQIMEQELIHTQSQAV